MKRYLLDTDIVVFLFRNNRKVYDHIKELSPRQIYISDVTVAELEYGNHCSGRYKENKAMLDKFLLQVNVITFADAIPLYAKERYRLRMSGLSIWRNISRRSSISPARTRRHLLHTLKRTDEMYMST